MTRPLRVLQLGTSGPLYGAERWIMALVRALNPALIESHVAVIDDTPGNPMPLLDAVADLGFATHAIAAPGRFNRAAVAGLRDLIERERIDIIHSHGYKADLATVLAVRHTPVRTVATPHGWSHDAGWKLRLYEAMDRRLFRAFDATAPLSPDLYAGLVHDASSTFKARLHLIPNGVDLDEISAAGTPPADFTNWHKGGPIIGYVGQLIARKGLATLLEAIAALPRHDVSLVLVGDGEDRMALEQQAAQLGIRERILFAGFRPDRLAWMRGFDVFVLPSFVEGIPRCLMEAMALGVPVVASAIPGTVDIVKNHETGLLFPPGDSPALASALMVGLNPATARQQADAAKTLIETRYSAAAMARGYERLFARLCPSSVR